MATHSSVLAWRIPWTEEPGGLQSLGLQNSPGDRRENRFRVLAYTETRVSLQTDR